ncbi:MAG: hypothetical protein IKV48_00580 [Eggerthellaceae bacterium]|nr:hypothetical protein [Eggerthellaceae bacterium]
MKGKRYFEFPSKHYCEDVGLRKTRLWFRQQEETRLMENVIYSELVARGHRAAHIDRVVSEGCLR